MSPGQVSRFVQSTMLVNAVFRAPKLGISSWVTEPGPTAGSTVIKHRTLASAAPDAAIGLQESGG